MLAPHSSGRRLRILFAAATFVTAALTAPAVVTANPPAHPKAAQNYGKLPLSFEANQGQSDPRVKFHSQGNGYSLSLTNQAAVLSLAKPAARQSPLKSATEQDGAGSDTIEMQLFHANPSAQVAGADQLPGTANYFRGKDPAQWHTNIPTFAKVKYTNVYDGIDLIYYGNQRQLEYDFVVAPGKSPRQIEIHFAGAQRLELTPSGDLEVIASNGEIAFHAPILYQQKDGQRQPVEGSFTLLADNNVAFAVGQYDPARALVIDPLLAYSTYLGGSGAYTDEGYAITVDATGAAYVTGDTNATNFPITGDAYQQPVTKSCCGNSSIFVTKLNPEGTALVYSTYLDGNQDEHGRAIAVDSSGNAYITGTTTSGDFPTTPLAYQPTRGNAYNVFVTKLNPAGSALIYSTYIGGNGNATGSGIAVDASGNVFVTGNAVPGFGCYGRYPTTTGAFQTQPSYNGCGDTNAFITRLSADGSKLAYSTYLGGPGSANGSLPNGGGDYATAIAIDAEDNAYVAGVAGSTKFPITTGAFQTVNNGSNATAAHACDNAFVTKINAKGSALIYSTYLGGSGSFDSAHNLLHCDTASSLAIDAAGNAYIGGTTGSSNFPIVKGSYLTVNPEVAEGGFSTGFVSKLNPTGTALVYSTYLGGSDGSSDGVNGLGIDTKTNVYVTGFTTSENFPHTAGAYQTQNPGASNLAQAPFVTELNPAGSVPLFSSYFGGDDGDFANALAVDAAGAAYITGQTGSTNFPMSNGAYQTKNNETTVTAFVAKLNITDPISPAAEPVFSSPSGTYTAPVKVTITSATVGATIYCTTNGVVPTTSSTKYTGSITVASSETIECIAADPAAGYSTSAVAIAKYVIATATPAFTPPAGTYTAAQKVTIASATTGAVIYYTTNGTTPTTASTKYTGAITVSATETLEAIAVAGSTSSIVATAKYTIAPPPVVATPVFAPPAGTYSTAQKVTVADATAGAVIYCTTNGTAPTTTSTKYAGPITVAANETLECIATAPGYTNSPVVTAKYVIEAPTATPFFAPPAGTYTAAQKVTITDTTPGAVIYYTTNGTTPTTASTKYTGPIMISASETIEAIAVATGYSNSLVATAKYVIETPAATPVFAPPAGTYVGAQKVVVTSTTAGAVIYCTTNGTTPTTASTKYAGPITIAASETLECIATAPGYLNSAVGIAKYVIETPAATPVISDKAGIYESVQTVGITDATPGAVIYYTTNGAAPTTTSAKYTAPITISASETITAIAVATGFGNSALASAAYTIVGSPSALSAPATAITNTGATLNAVVDTDGLAGTYYFQYGTSSTALTSTTAKTTLSAVTTPIDASAKLATLAAKTTYYFQVVVTTAGGTSSSSILSFTTAATAAATADNIQ